MAIIEVYMKVMFLQPLPHLLLIIVLREILLRYYRESQYVYTAVIVWEEVQLWTLCQCFSKKPNVLIDINQSISYIQMQIVSS